MTTDWEKQLSRRAAALERARQTLDADIAAARLDGHSFREIGRWASVNHERARGIARTINGHTRTRDEEEARTGKYQWQCPECGWVAHDTRKEEHKCGMDTPYL
ncbi:hypothetical protein ABZV65_19515 [Streptomyces bauhiniae]|uniref:hypothetical protein n=1 Tax=Streptomyces bauhiniae TaxID=2340725 RepID=UPI0033A4184A